MYHVSIQIKRDSVSIWNIPFRTNNLLLSI